MLRHNLLLIYRNFKRFKSTFFINLIGLSTGLACALFIYLWVSDELKIDRFHEKESQLFQIMEHRQQAQGIITPQSTSALTAETLLAEFPEVEQSVAVAGAGYVTLSYNENNLKAVGRFSGSDFFNIFSYKLLKGDENQVLADKSSIVISESLAKKLFKEDENIIGKTIKFQHDKEYFISGIFEDIPTHSSENFEFLLPFERYKEIRGEGANWFNTDPRTFVVLREGADVKAFNNKIVDMVKTKTNNEVNHRTLFATPYADAYLYSKYENGVQSGGRIEYVRLFSIIAVFILLIACITFMNLSTARASRRLKEVGIKKAIGASRKTLISQYIGESMLLSILSVILALILVYVFLPQFNTITGKALSLEFNYHLIFSIVGITLFTGLISGSYPALYLSGFNPISVLKGKLNTSVGEVWARKGLVVFQFSLSIILIVSVLVVYKQIEYVQNKNIGYERENIIYFEREGKFAEEERLQSALEEIKNLPGIVSASSTGHDLTGHNGGTWGVKWEGKDPNDKTEFQRGMVNFEMLETLGFEVLEGRSFSSQFITDTAKIIFNEAAIKFMGMEDPIGKKVNLWGDDREILGVVKDFHFESLHLEVKPMFFIVAPGNTDKIMARIEGGKEKEVIANLQQFYEAYNPGFPFEFIFLDEEYQAQYQAELRVASLSKYFAGLAVLISCLGLFGLAAFTAERRLKEIGIRKVLGSSEFGIVRLLSGDFTRMVLTAICISLPLSYFIVKNWLDNFAFKIELEWWYFISAGLAALLVAWLTVGTQALKASRINPVNCLKDE